MKIVLVSSSAPPKNSPESLQTGRYLRRLSLNHEVTLLTTHITGGWEPADETVLQYLDGVKEIVELKGISPRIISLIKKIWPSLLFPDDAFFFHTQAKKAIAKIADKPDVIFSRSAPFSSAMLAFQLAEFWNVPWVMHLSDPWADSPFLKTTAALLRRHNTWEKKCVERADLVTLTSSKTISFYQAKYPSHKKKFRFLPNVFDDTDTAVQPQKDDGKIKFVFTGRLYGDRSLHHFLSAIEKAVSMRPNLESKSEFIFAGFFVDENIRLIRESGLKNLEYKGALSMGEARRLQQDANVLVVIDALQNDARYDLFFPSKLLDYMAAYRPILAITGKGSTTYDVVENKFGKCFHHENLNELPAYIVAMVDQYKSHEPFFKGASAEIETYAASKNAARLEAMFNEVLKK